MSRLQTTLAAKQDELMPKKKFTFTTRKKERDAQDDGSNISTEYKHEEQSMSLLISGASKQCGFSNRQDEKLSMQVRTYRCLHYMAQIKYNYKLCC